MITKIVDLGSAYEVTKNGAVFLVPKSEENPDYPGVQAAISGGLVAEAPAVTVPASISKVQFVRAARAADLWTTYQAAIEAHPDWPYVTEIPRNDPIVQAMASQLGFTEEQLDALWIAGASL